MDRNQLRWLQPAIERFSSAFAFWSKVSNSSLNHNISTQNDSPVLIQGPLIGEHLLSLMLHPQANCRQNASLVYANYKVKDVLLTLWTDMQCQDNEFFSNFQRMSPAMDSLHKEIVQFYEYMKPFRIERIVRKQTVNRISDIILNNLRGVDKVSCFGSYKTGLCLPTSDIDLVVFGQWPLSPLSELKDILIESGVTTETNLKVLDRASVPILKFMDTQTGIRFDISFNMINGTKSINVIKEFLAEFPPLRYLVIVLKHFLLQRYLNEVFTGGIGSYTLIMMTVSFLQLHPCINCRIQSKCNLGQLLVDFFELYGRSFNYQRVAIRVRDGGSYVPKSDLISQFNINSRGLSMLCVEDPLDISNDIGRGSYATSAVCTHFENAFMLLQRCTGFINSGLYKMSNISHISILGRIVGVNSKIVEYRSYISTMFNYVDDSEADNDDQADNDFDEGDENTDAVCEISSVDDDGDRSHSQSTGNDDDDDKPMLNNDVGDESLQTAVLPSFVESSTNALVSSTSNGTQSTAVQTTNAAIQQDYFEPRQLHIPHPLYFRYNFPMKQYNRHISNDDHYYYSSVQNRPIRNGRRFFNRQRNRSNSTFNEGSFSETNSVNRY